MFLGNVCSLSTDYTVKPQKMHRYEQLRSYNFTPLIL
jgi:hypothetical protein